MKKEFKKWHNKKETIDSSSTRLFFHEREIWFCHLGANVGFEADGKGDDFLRPMVVLKKFNAGTFWGIPLTKQQSKKKSNAEKYYYSFSFLPNVVSTSILSQVRLIDAKRLVRLIGHVSEADFDQIKKRFKALLP